MIHNKSFHASQKQKALFKKQMDIHHGGCQSVAIRYGNSESGNKDNYNILSDYAAHDLQWLIKGGKC